MRTKLYVCAVIVLLAAGGGAAWWVKDRVAGEPAGFARPQKPAAAPVSTPAQAAGDNYDGNYDDGYGAGAGAGAGCDAGSPVCWACAGTAMPPRMVPTSSAEHSRRR